MRRIKFQVVGSGAETDAPTVDDLIDQIRDYFDILREVEEAVAEDGTAQIEWRIVSASKASPLAFEADAFARQFAMNVDRRAEIVVSATSRGLNQLQTRLGRPEYFSEKALLKAEKMFERVTNGLAQTIVDYGPDLPKMSLTPGSAYAAASNVKRILSPPLKVYKEIGSVEGVAHGFDRDGWGNPVLKIKHRMTSDEVTCRLSGQALAEIEARRVGELWRNCRVQLYGTIHFRGIGRISRVDAYEVRFLRGRSELPDVDDILDESFTGGLRSEDHLERIRNGDLS